VTRHVGDAPDDDAALLVIARPPAPGIRIPRPRVPP
jgi:hypothetical protein